MLIHGIIHQTADGIMNGLTFRILLLVLLIPLQAMAHDSAMHMAYMDYPLFFSRDEDGRMNGVFYEIIMEAVEKGMHIKTVWNSYPWKRCQACVEHGEADAMLTTLTPQRLEYARTHEDPVFKRSVHLFTYAGHPRLETIRKIKDFEEIGKAELSVITYLGNGWIEKNTASRGIRVHIIPQADKIWHMLVHKRGDLVIEWPGSAWPEIDRLGLAEGIVQTEAVIRTVPFYLLISKKSPYCAILPEFNKLIRQMHENGTIRSITEKYFPSDPGGKEKRHAAD